MHIWNSIPYLQKTVKMELGAGVRGSLLRFEGQEHGNLAYTSTVSIEVDTAELLEREMYLKISLCWPPQRSPR